MKKTFRDIYLFGWSVRVVRADYDGFIPQIKVSGLVMMFSWLWWWGFIMPDRSKHA